MDYIFNGCESLEYINIINFNKNRLSSAINYFDAVPDNAVICYNHLVDDNDKILNQIKSRSCYIIDCSNDFKSKINNKEYLLNNSLIKICKCNLDKCLTCSKSSLQNNKCTICNINYYPKENENYNNGFINCYSESQAV